MSMVHEQEKFPESIRGRICLLPAPGSLSSQDVMTRVQALYQRLSTMNDLACARPERRVLYQDLLKGVEYRVRLEVLPWLDRQDLFHLFDLQNYKLHVEVAPEALSLLFEDEAAVRQEIHNWMGAAVLWLGWCSSKSRMLPLLWDLKSRRIRLSVTIDGYFAGGGGERERMSRNVPLFWDP